MEKLGYAVPIGQASLTGYVTKDISAGDWDTYGEHIGHVTGTRSLLETANIAHTEDLTSWTTVSQSSTATSEHSLIPVLGTNCPRQRFSTTLVPQQIQLWARLQVRYESSGTKSTYSGVSKNVYCLMKIASISTYGVAGISRSMVDMMV